MAFTDFPEQQQIVTQLQRSLERGRLAHGYLFAGSSLEILEATARTLAKVLNCQNPRRGASDIAIDCCEACLSCRKIEHGNHADVLWVRPESRTRIISIDQVTLRDTSTGRTLTEFNALKPTEGDYKVGIMVAADRMNQSAANAFLKTLEEPSARTVFVLLSTDPQRLPETIESRCQRLNFAGEATVKLEPEAAAWLRKFTETAAAGQAGVIGRYGLLSLLLERLGAMRGGIETDLTAKSPSEQYPDAEPKQREKWEDELAAGIEAEYRRQRSDLLATVHLWLRDVWICSLGTEGVPLQLAEFATLASTVGQRIGREAALANLRHLEQLQHHLFTNVQESLAFEVGFLKLKF